MIHFEHIEFLWLLLVVAACGMIWGYAEWRNRRKLESWADRQMFGRLIPDRSGWRPAVKMALTLTGFALLVVALANPQMGTKIEKGKRAGSDVAICLDVSNSMMAEDIQPNRLERSKRVVTNIMNTLAGDRISLVVFAGASYIQMPLTNDYGAAKLFLDQVSCDMIASQGTAIGDAIEKAMQTFGYGDADQEWVKNKGRAIIVISDGENHEDDAVDAARRAAREGVRICTIGMGLPDGAPIPEYDPRGRKNSNKRERGGSIIMTKLNEDMMRQIASAGNGVYVHAGNAGSGLSEIGKVIEGLEKEDYGEAVFSAYESRYQYPLAAAILCLLAEVMIFERRNRKWSLTSLTGTAALLLCIMPTDASAQANRKLLREGNRNYKTEKYDQAELNYRRALEADTTDFRGQYNLAASLYRQEKYDEAAMHYAQALASPDIDDSRRAKALHNVGNSMVKAGLQNEQQGMQYFQQAVKAYQDALKLDPKNDDTRYNLAYARRLLQQAQQQQQQQGGGSDQQNQDQQQNQQQQQGNNQNKDQQQQQNQQQQGNQQDQQQQQGKEQQQKKQAKPQEQRKQDAERMLEAVKNNERQTLKEQSRKEQVSTARHTDKDW